MDKFIQLLGFLFAAMVLSQSPVKIKDAFNNESFNVSCTNNLNDDGCLLLNVDYPELKKTDNYQVSAISYNPPVTMNQGTPINAYYDDLFAVKLDIPFKFCFFNQYFDGLVVGSNGMITFNLDQLGNINYPNVQWQNPNTGLSKNSIFGVYNDLVFSAGDTSEIYYSTVGNAPYRKFIISFYEGRIAGCTERSSSQIVIYETTNIIDVFVDKKPAPCSTRKFENSLIGIVNNDGTVGYSPPGRNTGNWQALKEGWRFTPLGGTIVPQIKWTDSQGQIVGSGIQTTVCPTANEVYTATVNYELCGNSIFTLKDDFIVTFDPSYPAAENFTKSYCGTIPVAVNLNNFQSDLTSQNPANFNFSFYTTLQSAQNGINAIPASLSLISDTVIYVRIQNPIIPGCFRIAVLTLNIITKTLLKTKIEICDTNNDNVEHNYDLSLLNDQLFSPGTSGISYHITQADANSNTNPIVTTTITPSTNIWVRLQEANCSYVLGPVSFQFKQGANINSPLSFSYMTCDINDDNVEPFDYALQLGALIGAQQGSTYTAYQTYNEAVAGTGSGLTNIMGGTYQVFIRVQIPNGCFAVVIVNMSVIFKKIHANEKTEYICFNGIDDVSINLITLSAGMLISAAIPVIEFYDDYAAANAGLNPISPIQTITENGHLVTKKYFVRFEESDFCYTVRAINVNLVHPVTFKSDFVVCDFNHDNTENIQLAQYSGAIVGNQNATTLFYLTQADAQNGSNPIISLTITGSQQIFVKIISYNCFEIYPINFSLTSNSGVNTAVNILVKNICDNNNDGSEMYNLLQVQPQIYNGSNAIFSYYMNYDSTTNNFTNPINNPTQFVVSGNSTVYVKIEFPIIECFSVAKVQIQMTFLTPIVLSNAILDTCDKNFDLNETFQLIDALPQLFNTSLNTLPLSDMSISYYLTAADANLGNPAGQIGNSIITNISSLTVWVRFQSRTTGCYSIASIQLNTYFPPKAIDSTISVCDENLDGSYEVNLLNFTNLMVNIPNALNTFSFYLTQQDAQNGINAISNPSNYSVSPFPTHIWVKIQNIPGCYDFARIRFVFGNKISLLNPGPFKLNNVCDIGNDGIENVNLLQFEQQIYSGGNATFTYYPSLIDLNAGTNAIVNPSAYLFNQNTGSNIIYVKISVTEFCSEKAEIHISLKPTPFFTLPTQYICPDGFLTYKANIEGYNVLSYVWKDPNGNIISTTAMVTGIKMVGIYSLTIVSDNGCSYTATMEVKYFDVPVIQNININGAICTVFATGSKPILYSIDGITWQSSNVFNGLPGEIITFYVKYIGEECIIKREELILDIKNTITPNGDGRNDRWIVKNLRIFGDKVTNAKVFDRYQTLIFEQNTNTEINWDGTIAGRPIPTANYWYIITLPNGKTYTGWLVVKNRE
ncbi:T9SS type B sorting domain-containing protein [Chryseobacterium culicis]|uniref:Gliding motility-associated C-terminal domain-containing protein n=1 Tax=Chryseobacterium culicis TaxID=680127 RepID=A0A1H6IQ30_CHRCI|nr:T9SS type B sorting domain-containing protein [Chryseobacterium culicis]SEH49098.1 gliding motility-associated C-terminal domain-containing protein [Chryseobacterium culicis]